MEKREGSETLRLFLTRWLVPIPAFTATALACFAQTGAPGESLDRSGTQWAPYIEWRLENPTYDGNPYDLAATATFVHAPSGEKRTTGMFYDGGNTWTFRFTGTRIGTWSFSTSSQDGDLHGRQGEVVIEPNPNRKATGFIANYGNKWVRPVGQDGDLNAFVPQLVMYANPKFFHDQPQKIDADIQTFLVEHGFNGFHVMGSCHWFDIGDGQGLKRPTSAHIIIYKEDAESIEMDLRQMPGSQPAVAVDAKKVYAAIDFGQLEPKKQTWVAPYRSDWAIAVGQFE